MFSLHLEIDDNFAKKIAAIAQQQGFLYERAICCEQLCQKICEKNFNLLIIDENIKEILNTDLIKNFLTTSLVYPPIIIITKQNSIPIRNLCFDSGIIAYFQKDDFNEFRFIQYLQAIKTEHNYVTLIKTIRIAVIDDDYFSLKFLKSFFSMLEAKNVNYYQNSTDFLDNSSHFIYDLFLIDLIMLDYTDENIISHIREQNQQSTIILITPHNNSIMPYYLSVGTDDFIFKPIDFKSFMAKMIFCLNQYSLKKALVQKNVDLPTELKKDSLTGLYSRVYFIKICKKKLMEISQTMQPIAFILLDIDNFKNVNDEYGHLSGDYVLKNLGLILKKTLRKSDIICRWGGEEFIILLADSNLADAKKIAEKLRLTIAFHYFENIGNITASFGLTKYYPADTNESIFKRLDQSLYLAKLTGRNKVVSDNKLPIFINKKPISIEWGPFFKSHNSIIDAEHHMLINLSNEFIHTCFTQNKTTVLLSLFEMILSKLIIHAAHEEEILCHNVYPFYLEHKKIHKNLLTEITTILNNLQSEKPSFTSAGRYIIQNIIVEHIVKDDFDFYYLFTKKPHSKSIP